MNRFGFDVLAAVTLAITAFLGAIAPLYLVRQDRLKGGTGRSKVFVLGNMFSAGVMVSAGFCHLLGEAVRDMPAMQFPIVPFLCGCGFLLTLCADTAATALSNSGPTAATGAMEVTLGVDLAERGTLAELASRPRTPHRENSLETVPLRTAMQHTPKASHKSSMQNGRLLRSTSDASSAPHGARWGTGSLETDVAASTEATLERSNSGAPLMGGGRDALQGMVHLHPAPDSRLGSGGAGSCHAVHDHASGRVSFVTAMLMGVALCFHSLLEGAAMGAQETISNSLHIFIAIVSHKGLAAYALGSSIVESNVE